MEYFHGTTLFFNRHPSAVTLGKFDGVHLGHQKLMRHIRSLENQGLQSVVFALCANSDDLIMTDEEQRHVVEELGISCLIQCPFVKEISGMEPEEFVRDILVHRLHARQVTVGPDFRFGYRRSGDVLRKLSGIYGFQVDVIEKERYGDREISSTYVREALKRGDMELAEKLLGRPFFVMGEVLHGRKIGRALGMPTANQVPGPEKLLPPNGVYAAKAVVDGISYPGITNIGYKPTVGETFRGVETYLFDREIDLYGKTIMTELYCFERPEQKFASLEELKRQMHRDIAFGKEYFRE